jgi:hypothetical protein
MVCVSTPILTANRGWSTMGELVAGDQVFGPDGFPTDVTYISPVQRGKSYRLTFSDGSEIVACADHLWETSTRSERRSHGRTRAEIEGRGRNIQRRRLLDDEVVQRVKYDLELGDLPEIMTIAEIIEYLGVSVSSSWKHFFYRYKSVGYILKTWSTGRAKGVPRRVKTFNTRELLEAALVRVEKTAHDQGHKKTGGESVVRNTQEIVDTLRTFTGHANHSIPVTQPLQYPHASLLIDPYTLGVWLGDGYTSNGNFCGVDHEIADHVRETYPDLEERRDARYTPENGHDERFRIWSSTSLRKDLKALGFATKVEGVYTKKFIPTEYLTASEPQRRALLAGLLDTDGSVGFSGGAEFYNSNETLAQQAYELILGLGYRATYRTKTAKLNEKDCGDTYAVSFTPHEPVFGIERKEATRIERSSGKTGEKHFHRYIVDAVEVPPVDMKCITVDNQSHLYLVGKTLIPTHNTSTLNALIGFIDPQHHLIIIEDTPELNPPPFVFTSRAVTRRGRGEMEAVDQNDLMRSALRSRPEILAIGEARGGELVEILKAQSTGHHGSFSSLHADSAADSVVRMKGMLRETGEGAAGGLDHKIASAIDLIIFQKKLDNGLRRITSVLEIIKPEQNSVKEITEIQVRQLWTYDIETDTHIKLADISDELRTIRGVPANRAVVTMEEIETIHLLSQH